MSGKRDNVALNRKQQAFVNAYIINGFNATQAAITAGYSENTAYSIGHENLRKPEIKAAINAVFDEYAMSAAEVLARLTEIARGDIADIIGNSGVADMEYARANYATGLIKRMKRKTVTSEDSDICEDEIEVYDKLDALKTLAKYHKLLTDRVLIDDWRSMAIADIKSGRVVYEALADAFDDSLAAELFTEAGIAISLPEGNRE